MAIILDTAIFTTHNRVETPMVPAPIHMGNLQLQSLSYGTAQNRPPHTKPVQIFSLCSPCICLQVGS